MGFENQLITVAPHYRMDNHLTGVKYQVDDEKDQSGEDSTL